jgi:hypothetical protein
MKLRLSWILPLVQLPLAIFLLQWGEHSAHSAEVIHMRYDTLYAATPTLICGGINAPARLLAATSVFFYRVDHAPPTIVGFTLDSVFFMIGLLILWYLVGRAFDNRELSPNPRAAWTTTKLFLVGGPLVLLGSLFFYDSLQGFLIPERWNNRIGNIAQSVFVLIWSLVLLGLPALKLAQRLRLQPNS